MAATDTGPPAALGRRERKKLETRRALRESALRLFAEQGYDRTTIEDIAEAADLAPRTFFLHFTSKEDVLVGDTTEQLDRFRAALAARPAEEDPLLMVRAAVRDLPAFTEPDRDELILRTRLAEEAPALLARTLERYTAFERVISDAVARRLAERAPGGSAAGARSGLYAELLGAAAMSALRVALTAWCRDEGTVSLTDLLDDAFDQLAAGLSRPAG